MAVRTERRYSSTNRSIIHRRYGVALSCKPYRFFLSLSPSPPPSRSSPSPSRVPGWFHSRFNAFQMIGGIADVITMKWLSSCCAHLMLLRWIHCSRARPYWESIIDHRWHHRWRERGKASSISAQVRHLFSRRGNLAFPRDAGKLRVKSSRDVLIYLRCGCGEGSCGRRFDHRRK